MKTKGLKKAIEKFNNWPATARIYIDFSSGRIWTDTFVKPEEGRFTHHKDCVSEIHNKEGLNTEGITITEEEILEKIEIEKEEINLR